MQLPEATLFHSLCLWRVVDCNLHVVLLILIADGPAERRQADFVETLENPDDVENSYLWPAGAESGDQCPG